MKRSLSLLLIALLVLTTTFSSMTVFADTEIDKTAPVINSIEFVNGDNYDTDDPLTVKIDLTEEGTGLTELRLGFGDVDFMWETFYEEDEECGEDPILFTGEHEIDLNRQQSLPVGEYELTYIAARDVNGNWSELDGSKLAAQLGTIPKLHVTTSSHRDVWVTVSSFRFLQTDDLDRNDTVSAKFTFDANMSIDFMRLYFRDQDGNTASESVDYVIGDENPLKAGTHTIKLELDEQLTKGNKELFAIDFNEGYECKIESGATGFEDTVLHITTGKDPIIDPEIKDFSFRNTAITAPEVLKIDLDIDAHDNPINLLQLTYELESNGNWKTIEGEIKKKSNGKYYAEVPIGPFLTEGAMTLQAISVDYYDGGYTGYSSTLWRDAYPDLLAKGDVTVDSGYNITYFGSLGNSKVPAILEEMNSGETAVLDCRNYKTASKKIFDAIAGRDITIAFIDENVQWVFNGKDIKKSRCKTINLKSTIKVVSGESYGFPNDTKVAVLIFKDNGKLPGEVEMRINYEYLAAKYKFRKENMILTYLDENKNATVEDTNIDVAKDEYYEYEVDHNSTFVLSKNKAKIGTTKVSAVGNGLSSVKIKWRETAGNGYYVYRSTKRDSGYKKVATIKDKDKTYYVDKNVTRGKTYYYKVKPYSKNSQFNKTAKMRGACKAYTRLKAPRIFECKKLSGKLQVRIAWYGSQGAEKYYIYRSTKSDGTYKKIATVSRGRSSYTDKSVKKGKTYYYKVRAVHSTTKYSSVKSSKKSVTIK